MMLRTCRELSVMMLMRVRCLERRREIGITCSRLPTEFVAFYKLLRQPFLEYG
jgi:hypothetical protein